MSDKYPRINIYIRFNLHNTLHYEAILQTNCLFIMQAQSNTHNRVVFFLELGRMMPFLIYTEIGNFG